MSRQDEQFLAHYGVLGMRWGRRSANRHSGSSPTSSKPAPPKPKDASKMTMDDLKKANERLKAEAEYRKYLSDMNSKKESKFKQFLFDAASKAALGYIESAAKAYGTKVGGRKDPDEQRATKEKGKEKAKELISKEGSKPLTSSSPGKKKVVELLDWASDDWDW